MSQQSDTKLKKLTTTSYVLLGQLAGRPWSAYDLTKFLQRSIAGAFWPRAESHIYDELKSLAAHGLADVSTEQHGKRTRSVYSINEAGLEKLRDWLSEPGEWRAQEWEQMVKIYYSDCGTKEELLAHVRSIRESMLSRLRELIERLDNADPPIGQMVPRRWHMAALVNDYLLRETEALLDWTQWAEETVRDWPDTESSPEAVAFSESVNFPYLERIREILGQYGKSGV